MTRRLAIVLVLTLAAAALFLAMPQLDLTVAKYFYDPAQHAFSPEHAKLYLAVKKAVYLFNDAWIPLLVIATVAGFARQWEHRRAALFLLIVIALAPGLMVTIAKETVGRPRPVEVTEFGGTKTFVPALHTSEQAGKAALSGHVAMGFYFVAFAYLNRRRFTAIYAGGVLLGGAIAYTRMALGSHFLSDAVFTGLASLVLIELIAAQFTRRGWLAIRMRASSTVRGS